MALKPGLSSLWKQVDHFDQWISRPLFELKCPAVVESIVSVPGNFFGVPLFALGISPCLTLLLLNRHQIRPDAWPTIYLIVGFPLLFILWLWSEVLRGNRLAIRIFYGPALAALAPLGGWALLTFLDAAAFDEPNLIYTGYFQIATWCTSVIPVAVLKYALPRSRPATILTTTRDQEDNTKKHLSVLLWLFRRDGSASFPSGDAAGATAVAYPLIRCGDQVTTAMGIACVLASCFGRMYWKAHHFLDVLVGMLLAVCTCMLLEWLTASPTKQDRSCCATLWQTVTSHLSLLVTVIVVRLCSRKKIFQSGTISIQEETKRP